MSGLPSQQQVQHATSAPAAIPAGACALPHAAGMHAGEEAVSPALPAQALLLQPLAAHAAASAPAAMPLQLLPAHAATGAASGAPPARPAASASISGQGDTPGVPLHYSSGTGAALPQSSAAVGAPQHGAAAAAAQQQQQPFAAGTGGALQTHAAPALASLCMGQNDGAEPMTDARSRHQRAAATPLAAAPAPAPATIEGMGSPTASMHVAHPRESQGTARATILAGAAHSILTTAAAGGWVGAQEAWARAAGGGQRPGWPAGSSALALLLQPLPSTWV